MARLIALAWTAAAALVFWLVLGHGFVNYDTLYALVWGNDLAHGHLPDYDVPLAPTPHPLAIVVGIVLAPLGAWSSPLHDGAEPWVVVLAFLSLGAVGYLIYRLGAEWFGRAAGVLAAVIFLTRIPVLSFGVRAYVDIPLPRARPGRAPAGDAAAAGGAPVLVLLGLAGLIRPEAWLFSAAYLAWLWRGGAERSELVRLGALAAAAPVLWLASDWAVTGDPGRCPCK